jgi:hypothetical protein
MYTITKISKMTKVANMPISLIAAGGFVGISPLYN